MVAEEEQEVGPLHLFNAQEAGQWPGGEGCRLQDISPPQPLCHLPNLHFSQPH